jgi:hypothetical protein
MKVARTRSLALTLVLVGPSACQEPVQPGPMERAGLEIDRVVAGVQRSVGDLGLRAGQGVDEASRSIGTAARQVGTELHDRLAPWDPGNAASVPTAPGETSKANPQSGE